MTTEKLYLAAAEVLTGVENQSGSIRSLVYSSSYAKKTVLLKLACETLRYGEVLNKLLEECSIQKVSAFKNGPPNLAKVITYELVFGCPRAKRRRIIDAKLGPKSADLKRAVASLVTDGFLNEDLTLPAKSDATSSQNELQIPRYARVNTILTDEESVIENLTRQGFQLKYVDRDVSNITKASAFRRAISNLSPGEYFRDPHVPNLFVFHSHAKLASLKAVKTGRLILQDKSSCLATLALNPKPGATVLDTCAAPGMKSSHLAAIMANTGTLLCVDSHSARVKTLWSLLDRNGVTCALVNNADILREHLSAEHSEYAKVTHAMIDVPCSGSGTAHKRLDHLSQSPALFTNSRGVKRPLSADQPETSLPSDNVNASGDPKRLRSLGNLQAQILKHVLKRLPQLQRAVYATCSIHVEENEAVVSEALADPEIATRFRLAPDALPAWRRRGDKGYEVGPLCIRTQPEKDLTNGFFVAVFERIV